MGTPTKRTARSADEIAKDFEARAKELQHNAKAADSAAKDCRTQADTFMQIAKKLRGSGVTP